LHCNRNEKRAISGAFFPSPPSGPVVPVTPPVEKRQSARSGDWPESAGRGKSVTIAG
jgi:hypothetical protein